MSKLFSRIARFFGNRTPMGVDKAGNRYFARKEEIDGVMKEKRWVVFKGEDDPTSIPVLKKEEEEKKLKEGSARKGTSIGKVAGPDLRSFIRQFPGSSQGLQSQWDPVKRTGQGHGSRRHELRGQALLFSPRRPAKFAADNTLASEAHSSCS
ncbi:hypothetical protein L484_000608 [Morus notabilis]|uniref:NADH dehydrogenase [ubiquinone] 1 alpha subcomplex subunit 12 n=1 Tax=Morus notabilis TaxID=981085 RepID=W9SPJ3_9ROSA|nr:hypothetical protein L484_000608 [Morus notabilis]